MGLVVYVVLYDAYAAMNNKETLSMSFANSLRHPIRRYPVILASSYIFAHLHCLIPRRFDILRRFAEQVIEDTELD